MRTWCRVGAKCVCVMNGASWEYASHPFMRDVTFPRDGETYTIRDVEGGASKENFDDLFLRFEEIVNPEMKFSNHRKEPGWFVGFFRPLPPIDHLRELLRAPSPELEDA